MSPDLGFCGCEEGEDAVGGRVMLRARLQPRCRVHYWMSMERHACPDCGGLCLVVGAWKDGGRI